MAIKTILTEPNKILRQVSKQVEKVGEEEKKIMDDMLETMYQANGIGLAAIQIGIPKRIIVIDLAKGEEKKNPMYFVNPVIKNKNQNLATYEEGCLSIPEVYMNVIRPASIKVSFRDEMGRPKKMNADGLMARCIQHEMDHLEGILFIDYLSKLKQSMIIKKLSKQKKAIERIVV